MDHYNCVMAVTFTGSTTTGTTTTPPHTYIDYKLVTDKLTKNDWAAVLNSEHIDSCAKLLTQHFMDCIVKARQTSKSVNTQFQKLKPWIRKELTLAVREREDN